MGPRQTREEEPAGTPESPARRNLRSRALLVVLGVGLGLLSLSLMRHWLHSPGQVAVPTLDADGNAPGSFTPVASLYEGIHRPSADPEQGAELIEGKNGIVSPRGFIGEDVPLPKPPGTWRILGLGDSVSLYFTIEGKNHLMRVARAAPAIVGRPTDLLNLAVAGTGTSQQVARFEARGLEYTPDLVILGYTLNDAMDFVEVARTLDPQASTALTVGDDVLVVHEIITAAMARTPGLDPAALHARYVAPQAVWRGSLASLNRLGTLSRTHGFRVLLVIFPVLFRLDSYYLSATHQELAKRAHALGFDVIDLTEALAPHPVAELRVYPAFDVIHPSPLGYSLAADRIIDWLRGQMPWGGPAGLPADGSGATP